MSCSASPLSTQAAPPAPACQHRQPRTPASPGAARGIGKPTSMDQRNPTKAWGRSTSTKINLVCRVLRRPAMALPPAGHPNSARPAGRAKEGVTDTFAQPDRGCPAWRYRRFHFSVVRRLPDDAVDKRTGVAWMSPWLVTYDAHRKSNLISRLEPRPISRDDELANWLRQLADRMRPAPGQPCRAVSRSRSIPAFPARQLAVAGRRVVETGTLAGRLLPQPREMARVRARLLLATR